MGRRTRLTAALALAGAAVFAVPPAATALRRVQRSWDWRVAVEGGSMGPRLRPGDWLLVDPDGFAQGGPAAGELVVVPDPRPAERWLVKRVWSVDLQGRLDVRGDAPEASTDSRTLGMIDPATVIGRPWLRYWPLRRAGPIG